MDGHRGRSPDDGETLFSGPVRCSELEEVAVREVRRAIAEAIASGSRDESFFLSFRPTPKSDGKFEVEVELSREDLEPQQAANLDQQQAADLEHHHRKQGKGNKRAKRDRKKNKAQKRRRNAGGNGRQPVGSGYVQPQPMPPGPGYEPNTMAPRSGYEPQLMAPRSGYEPHPMPPQYGYFGPHPMPQMAQTQGDAFVRPGGSWVARDAQGGFGTAPPFAQYNVMPAAQFGSPSIRPDGPANWFTQHRERGRGFGMAQAHAQHNTGMPGHSSSFPTNPFTKPPQ